MNDPITISPSAATPTGVVNFAYNAANVPQRRPFGDVVSCLPAYLALFIAIGAGCYAISASLSMSGISTYLWYALVINIFISFGLQCGRTPVQRFCRWARLVSAIFLPLSTVLVNSTMAGALDSEAAVNDLVALLVGGVTVMSVLAIGASFSNHTVPIAAPLVPALSFFGLLNSISVNAETQVGFLIFVASAIYLISYERMLSRRSGELLRNQSRDRQQHAVTVGHTAGRYLIACTVWFALFMAASALLYYPVDNILPQVIKDPWSRGRNNRGAAATDWRGSSRVVELRGGYISLSDTVVMQVTTKGVPPSLWRGRVYENYSSSNWEINENKEAAVHDIARLNLSPLAAPDPKTILPMPRTSPELVRDGDVVTALIEPEFAPFRNLFFPGRARGIQTNFDVSQVMVDSDGIVTLPGSFRAMVWPYNIEAQLTEESPAALLQAPGLTPEALKQWRNDPVTSSTLEVLPNRQEAGNRIRAIAANIQQNARAAGRPLVTPYEKGEAVRDFLVSGYTYSLASPQVPSSEDAVVFFLTNSRQGACDMFASAAALLLRAMDVPARLATGYLATETPESDTAGASAGEEGTEIKFPLRERDAHAWVEYYVPRAGWLTMDPTEGTRTTEVPLQAQIAQLLRLPQLNIPWKMLVLPALGLVLLLTGILWPMMSRRSLMASPGSPVSAERLRITEAYNRAVRLLKRRVPHYAHYTPQEYEAAVAASELPIAAQQEFTALTYLSVAARYATVPPAVGQNELESCLHRLQQSLK